MTQEIVVRHSDDQVLAITEIETRFAMAIRQRELLESYIKDRLKPDKHFYTVGEDPGRKPSLTKEGAELINLPHALKPKYNILSGPEKPPADNSPFQITVNCSLWRNDKFEGEGIGSASSYITKKDGSFQPRQKDPGLCYNATVKMASKSAYIAATLNSTAASEFFTQDLEDDQTGDSKKIDKTQHWCITHNTAFFKKGKMTSFAHPIEGIKDWCHEPKAKEVSPESPVETPPDAPPQATVAGEAQVSTQQPVKPDRDPKTITSFTELYRACDKDFGMRSSKEVIKELGYNSQADITETPAECYIKIVGSRAH